MSRPSPSQHAANCKKQVKRGNDGAYWVSQPDKNGVYKWKKLKETAQTTSPDQYYAQFGVKPPPLSVEYKKKLTSLKTQLAKLGVKVYVFGWDEIWDSENNCFDELRARGVNLRDDDYVFYSANHLFTKRKTGKMSIVVHVDASLIREVNKVFSDLFGAKVKKNSVIL